MKWSLILKENNGKVATQAISKKKKDVLSRDQRKNRMFQIRKNKRDEIISKKRCIGTLTGCPNIVVRFHLIVNLNNNF